VSLCCIVKRARILAGLNGRGQTAQEIRRQDGPLLHSPFDCAAARIGAFVLRGRPYSLSFAWKRGTLTGPLMLFARLPNLLEVIGWGGILMAGDDCCCDGVFLAFDGVCFDVLCVFVFLWLWVVWWLRSCLMEEHGPPPPSKSALLRKE